MKQLYRVLMSIVGAISIWGGGIIVSNSTNWGYAGLLIGWFFIIISRDSKMDGDER